MSSIHRFKQYSPLEVLSFLNPFGEVSGNIINGFSYTNEHRTFFRAGLLRNALYFDDWHSPKPFGFAYNPDKYQFLITGDPNIPEDIKDTCVPYVDESRTCGTIDVSGGFDAYLSRLKSKKRSELKKIASRMECSVDRILHLKYLGTSSIAELEINSVYYDRIKNKIRRESNLTFSELMETFDTEMQNFVFFKYLIDTLYYVKRIGLMDTDRNDCIIRSVKSIIVLGVYKDGERVCNTYGVVDSNDVAYCLVDVNRTEHYLAKDACVANIMWAANSDFKYVDFNNAIQTKDTVAKEEDFYRVQYKNALFTSIYTPTLYFSSQEDLDSYLEFKSYEESPEDENNEREETQET